MNKITYMNKNTHINMVMRILCALCTLVLILSVPMQAYCAEAGSTSDAATAAEAGTTNAAEGADTPADAVADTTGLSAPAEFRAVWFSFRDWQTYLKGKNESDFRSAFGSVCRNTADMGLNTIIVHVRSHNDAVYPSSCYPWSDEMLGGNPGFDPLADIVEIAHAYGLKVHAWINPYGYRNGKYCGDRTLATRENILNGIREILNSYAVDGIHFDDYFPPIGASAHNELLKSVCETVHGYGKIFGVSPGGNIDNNRKNGVDVDTWLSASGYTDYICPQIYWSNAYGKAGNVTMYSDRLAAWKSINKAGIPMYIGLAAYRVGEVSKSDPGWSTRSNNISSQVNEMRANGLGGYVLFSYSSMVSTKCATEMQNLRAIN